jgi:O-antigen/teichoic acid export membrane protein
MKNSRLNVDMGGLVHLFKLSYKYFLTTVINQSLPFLILPILTRYLNRAEFGNVALFSLYLSIATALSGISIPTVVSKYYFNSEKEFIARLIGNSILVVAGLSTVTLVLVAGTYFLVPSFFQMPLHWLLVIPFAGFAAILFSMGLNLMILSKETLHYGGAQVGNTAINLGTSLLLIIVIAWGWQGRLTGIVLGYFLSAIGAFVYLRRKGLVIFDITRKTTLTVLKIVLPLIPNSFQIVVISQVGIFFIQYYFSKDLLGLYSIGFQIAVMIYLLFATLNMSWSPYLFEQLSKEDKMDRLYITRLFYALFGVLFIGVVFLNLVSGLVLKIMTTPLFYGARQFVPWLSLGFFFQGMQVLLFPILIHGNKQKYISSVSFVNMIVMILMNIAFIKIFGHIGVAYAFCVTYFLIFLAFFWQAQRLLPLPWLRALKIW